VSRVVKHGALMSRKTIRIGLGCLAILGAAYFVWTVQASRNMARWDAAQSNVRILALVMELYRDDRQQYPSSFQELLSGINADLKTQVDRDILHNPFKDEYSFTSSSNGFTITVKSSAWFIDPKIIERKYALGEGAK
jgi:hypothetical protein